MVRGLFYCHLETVGRSMAAKGWLTGGVLAAVGASLCCVVPLVFVSLGIGGAWLASLQWFEPYRPYFIAATFVFLGLGFYALYLIPTRCERGQSCADPRVRRRQRAIFWSVTVILVVLIVIPWFGPLFY